MCSDRLRVTEAVGTHLGRIKKLFADETSCKGRPSYVTTDNVRLSTVPSWGPVSKNQVDGVLVEPLFRLLAEHWDLHPLIQLWNDVSKSGLFSPPDCHNDYTDALTDKLSPFLLMPALILWMFRYPRYKSLVLLLHWQINCVGVAML